MKDNMTANTQPNNRISPAECQINRITVIFICIVIICLGVLFFIFPKKEYSANENRYLVKAPVISLRSITDGDYMDDVKEYLTDHFPFRDFWVSLHSSYEELSGKAKINGIYLGKDHYLIGEYSQPGSTGRIITTLNKFSDSIREYDRDVNLNLMLIPNAITVYSDKLPALATGPDQMDTLREIYDSTSINNIDVVDKLNDLKNDYDLYYKTDHHWTSYGAYVGYCTFCESVGIEPAALDYFTAENVTDDFHGTLSAKVNRFVENGDVITVFNDPNAVLNVSYEDTEVVTDTLYNFDYLNERDKYSLFLDNLHPLITITNENSTTDRVLMLVKDSYANCMVPFLVHDYAKIIVFDTRYYKDGPSKYYGDHPEITDILILYNMNTLDTDTGVRGIF